MLSVCGNNYNNETFVNKMMTIWYFWIFYVYVLVKLKEEDWKLYKDS